MAGQVGRVLVVVATILVKRKWNSIIILQTINLAPRFVHAHFREHWRSHKMLCVWDFVTKTDIFGEFKRNSISKKSLL